MATTYNNNLRIAEQERPDNQNTWGEVLNDNSLLMLVEAISGYVEISVTAGNVTLSTNNGTTDQARPMILKATGTPGAARVLTAPAVSKTYIIWNASDASLTIKTAAGTAATIAVNETVSVFCDGTDFYRVALGGETAETISGAWNFTGTPQINAINLGHASDTTLTRSSAGNVAVEGNLIYRAGGTDVPITDGGTGSSTAAGARTSLGLVIGTDVQAYSALLAAIAGLAVTDGNFIVGNGTTWVAETGATARASLGLGSIATQASSSVSITGGSITGITDLAVADGGTGASTAAGARTALGLVIGTDVQAFDSDLSTLAGLAKTDGNFIVGNGTAWVAESGATARTSLGLGSLATASSINNANWSGTDLTVANGGTGVSTITGIIKGNGTSAFSAATAGTDYYAPGSTDVAVADGGTGASTATAALNNLLPSQTSNSGKVLQTDGTNASWQTPADGGDFESDGSVPMTGNLTISKATPSIGLTDSGGSDFSIRAESSTLVIQDVTGANDLMTLTQAGNVTFDGTAKFSASDGRLKTPFSPFNSGRIVDELVVGKYRWDAQKCEDAGFRSCDDAEHFGFESQSVYRSMGDTAAPLAPFDTDESGQSISGMHYRTLNDRELLAVAMMEIKELRKRVGELERDA